MANKKQCQQNKKVASGYPISLYHATIDKKGVCEKGLLPSCESGKSALGQCRNLSKTISFTVDKKIAQEIAHDLKTFINISNNYVRADCNAKQEGRNDCIPIEKYLEDYDAVKITEIPQEDQFYVDESIDPKYAKYAVKNKDGTPRTVVFEMGEPAEYLIKIPKGVAYTRKTNPKSIWKNAISDNKQYDLMRQGFVKIDYLTYRKELPNISFKEYKKKYGNDVQPCFETDRDDPDDKALCVMAKRLDYISDEDMADIKQRQLYELWSFKYLPEREKHGGRHNPWFAISTRVNSPRKNGLTPSDVGVYEVTGYFPSPHVNYGKENSIKINSEKVINDFDMMRHKYDGTNLGENYIPGEDINKEVRIVREMFNNLHEIEE